MPVTENPLTGSSSTTDDDAYTAASITPGANRLVLAAIVNTKATLPDTPTISGNNLTWVQVATVTYDTIASPLKRLTVFRALGASPTTNTPIIDFALTNQTGCIWSFAEFIDVDTTGTNGSGAVVQSATNSANTGTSLTVTLAAFGSTDNATYGAFAINDNVAINPGTGFTEIHDNVLGLAPVTGGETEWKDGNDTSVDASSSDAANKRWGGIAIEIKFAAAGGAATWPGWISSRGGWS